MGATPIDSDRIQTPYGPMTTPEIVAARRSLAELVAGDLGTPEQRESIGDLVVWATIELAERLSALVEHADGAVFGAALEALALDLGIVRGPAPHPAPPQRPPSTTIVPSWPPKRSRPRLQPLDLVNGRFVRR